jgi:hypothetical protein
VKYYEATSISCYHFAVTSALTSFAGDGLNHRQKMLNIDDLTPKKKEDKKRGRNPDYWSKTLFPL